MTLLSFNTLTALVLFDESGLDNELFEVRPPSASMEEEEEDDVLEAEKILAE